jgi:hypothetical protein
VVQPFNRTGLLLALRSVLLPQYTIALLSLVIPHRYFDCASPQQRKSGRRSALGRDFYWRRNRTCDIQRASRHQPPHSRHPGAAHARPSLHCTIHPLVSHAFVLQFPRCGRMSLQRSIFLTRFILQGEIHDATLAALSRGQPPPSPPGPLDILSGRYFISFPPSPLLFHCVMFSVSCAARQLGRVTCCIGSCSASAATHLGMAGLGSRASGI